MRNFMSVGVFGLGPVLPPERLISTCNDPRAVRADMHEWQLLLLDHLLTERLATRDELARVMDELERILDQAVRVIAGRSPGHEC